MSAETRYFGSPGHCYDIDGGWWHEPGSCDGTGENHRGYCCGVDAAARPFRPQPGEHPAMTATEMRRKLQAALEAIYRQGNYRDDSGDPTQPSLLASYLTDALLGESDA